jgi:hypothetical protein
MELKASKSTAASTLQKLAALSASKIDKAHAVARTKINELEASVDKTKKECGAY